jgi:hypothetical protein
VDYLEFVIRNEGSDPVAAVREHATDAGVLVGSGRPDIQLICSPPFTVDEAAIDNAVDVLDDTVGTVFGWRHRPETLRPTAPWLLGSSSREVAGVGSEPTISACPRSRAGGPEGGGKPTRNPMSAALCPAKPPGLLSGS